VAPRSLEGRGQAVEQSASLATDEQRGSGGVGLFVVEQLASRWGADRSERYRVWAELPLTI